MVTYFYVLQHACLTASGMRTTTSSQRTVTVSNVYVKLEGFTVPSSCRVQWRSI